MNNRLSNIIDDLERAGRLNVTAAQLAALLPETSADALRQALHRQQRRGRLVRLSRGTRHWAIVPLAHAASGAPPLETWLHRFLATTVKTPYYVGLLSAAETYGISPYAATVTQVMVPSQRRPMRAGRQRIVFHTRTRLDKLPTRWHETPDGRFLVSTPELTMLDLVRRQDLVGGLSRAGEVIAELTTHATAEGLMTALSAAADGPSAQRLGALLSLQGSPLADTVAAWVAEHPPRRTIPLTSKLSGTVERDAVFHVLRPTHPLPSRT